MKHSKIITDKLPFKIIMESGREILVHEALDEIDEVNHQPQYSTNGIRSYSLNGEMCPEDVLLTIMKGAKEILPLAKRPLEKPNRDTVKTTRKSKQLEIHKTLPEEELKSDFPNPVRTSYFHTGVRNTYLLRDLTAEEQERYRDYDYVAFEEYPKDKSGVLGQFWTKAQLGSGCGAETTMSEDIAKTYAKQPDFYSSTFCYHCNDYFPVGKNGEFTWEDGTKVGV